MAFYRLEPFGFSADNVLAGMICSSNVNLHIKKGAKRTTFEDFILKSQWENVARKMTPEEMRTAMSAFVTVKKKREKHG